MPKLLIELTGVEYDRLVAYAKTLRRTPQQQAAQIIGDTMEVFAAGAAPAAGTHDKSGYHVSQGPPAPSPRPSETLPGARRDDPSAEADRAAPAGALPPQE